MEKKQCFAIIDLNNLTHRARHAIKIYDDFEDCIGQTLTIIFQSIRKSCERFGTNHIVACFDSYSWRKEFYPEYKANRQKAQDPDDIEKHEMIIKVLNDVQEFLINQTNVTVLEAKGLEADDFIARWCQLHNDQKLYKNIIISEDSDFKQLVEGNVELYRPIANELYIGGNIYYQDGRRPRKDEQVKFIYGETWKIKTKKVKKRLPSGEIEWIEKQETFDPRWALFTKIIRGDRGDNIKAAYPRVREERMKRAYDDVGGEEWNNFINDTFRVGDELKEVKELFLKNCTLIDLTQQPQEIKDRLDEAIAANIKKEKKMMVQLYLIKFCNRYNLPNIAKQSDAITRILASPYESREAESK